MDFNGASVELRELDDSNFEEIKALYKAVFMGPPWNDDWSDDNQLTEYLLDLTKVRIPIRLGLYVDGKFVGFSIGDVRHWWGGTDYNIEELCIQTDLQGKGLGTKFMSLIEEYLETRGIHQIFLQTGRDMPAYEFYKKRGFEELTDHVSFFKDFKK